MSAHIRRIRRKSSSQSGMRAGVTLLTILGGLFLLCIIGLTVFAGVANSWLKDLPNYHDKDAFAVAQPTRILSADNKLLARLYLENRHVVSKDAMSPYVLKATVAVEDERFYIHNGVDLIGIMRSALSVLKGTRQGGSTITQQYIRNTILRDEATEISLKRKVREAYLALQLEKVYSKDDILAMYLNTVYYGEGAYGIETAAETYFAKEAKDLTIAQAALLAGLPQRPSGLSPYEYPKDALARRNQVLRRMLSNNFITQAQYEEAVAEKIKPKRKKNPLDGIYHAPYFVAQVKKELQQQFSKATVFGGGLTVRTTLNLSAQEEAEKAVKKAIGKKGPEGALVAIEPSTGYVRAVVGGRNYKKNKFSMATQAHRQPGSSFKTMTLTAALNDGMSPNTMVDSSSPATIPTKPEPWTVNNSEGKGHGSMSLASATYASVNTVYARVVWALGSKKVVNMAHKLGIKSELSSYPSIALGAQNVTPLEMASAYATLANEGVYNTPTFIVSVKDNEGKTLFKHEKKSRRVISKEVAYATTKILEGVVSHGTGTRAALSGREVAGKTGTSQQNRDVWFCGYTPQLATAIWVGWPSEQPIYINGMRAYGGTVCAPIFHDFMTAALKGEPAVEFAKADSPKYGKSYKMPSGKAADVTGMTLEEARKELDGYEIEVMYVYSDKPKGTLLNQRISGGKAVLTVSKGPAPKTPMPNNDKEESKETSPTAKD